MKFIFVAFVPAFLAVMGAFVLPQFSSAMEYLNDFSRPEVAMSSMYMGIFLGWIFFGVLK